MSKCGYHSGDNYTSNHKCHVVGLNAKHGSLCSHTLENWTNCKGNHITFSHRSTKMGQISTLVRQSTVTRTGGQRPMTEAIHMTTLTNTMVLGHTLQG